MSWTVPLAADRLAPAEIAGVMDCLRSGWLTMGPRTAQFELELARWLEVKHAVALSTGTAALQLAFRAVDVQPGDQVVIGALSRPAAAQAATMLGAEVRVVDVASPAEPCGDPDAVAARLTERTRAVVVSHPWGYPAPLSALRELCDARGIVLIEDATEALGASVARVSRAAGVADVSRAAGAVGHIGCLSLAWGRQLGVGHGGVLVSADERFAARARLLRSHALTSTTWNRHRGHADSYDVVDIGFNFRFDEPRAALALARLPALAAQIERRRAAEQRYRERLAGSAEWEPCFSAGAADAAAPLGFPLLAASASSRAILAAELSARGIETAGRVPLRVASGGPETTPAAEELGRRVLVLPLHPWKEWSEQDLVLDALKRAPATSAEHPADDE